MTDFEPPVSGVKDLPRSIEPSRDLWPGVSRRIHWRRRLVIGAIGLAAAASLVFILLPRAPLVPTAVIAGHPSISRTRVATDDSSRAKLLLSIGDVTVEPKTDLRVLGITPGEQRFSLRQGTISVQVQAPPRVFVVETPAAVATDLGCAYVLQVDSQGNGLLRVTAGQVELATGGRLAIVPAGAVAAIREGFGPGSPRREDASKELIRALDAIDFGSREPLKDSLAVAGVVDSALKAARVDDALSLWHLLTRVNPADAGKVYDRLAEFVPPPVGVTRDGVLALNREMLDLWWNYLPWTGYRKP